MIMVEFLLLFLDKDSQTRFSKLAKFSFYTKKLRLEQKKSILFCKMSRNREREYTTEGLPGKGGGGGGGGRSCSFVPIKN